MSEGPSIEPPFWMQREKSAMVRRLVVDAAERRARMKGQAEGLVCGILLGLFAWFLVATSF